MELKGRQCLAVSQAIGKFYIVVFNAVELLERVDILRRSLKPEDRENVQRELNKGRKSEIAEYLRDPDATFPTAIIVSCYPHQVRIEANDKEIEFFPELEKPTDDGAGGHVPLVINDDTDEGGSVDELDEKELSQEAYETAMRQREDGKFGEVIDGQHRLEGIRRYIEIYGRESLKEFQIPVVLMIELAAQDKGYVFSVINGNQRSVSSSLISDLFEFASNRSPQKTCHSLPRAFNDDPDGPFYRGLKMLGSQKYGTEFLTQGSFSKYVLQLISRRPEVDESRLKRNERLEPDPKCPLRPYFIAGQDEQIGRVLRNYFNAVKRIFPEEWERAPGNFVLRKTVGFAALIRALRLIWPEIEKDGDATLERFLVIVTRFKQNLTRENSAFQLTSDFVSSSGKGVIQLSNLMAEIPLVIKHAEA